MLDESEQEISQIAVRIERDSTVSFGEVERAEKAVRLGVPDRAVGIHIHIQLDEEQGMRVEPEVYTRNAGDTFRDTTGNEVQIDVKRENQKTEEPVPESGEGLIDQGNIQDESRGDDVQESLQEGQGGAVPSGTGGLAETSSGGSQPANQESSPAVTEMMGLTEESTVGETEESSVQESATESGTAVVPATIPAVPIPVPVRPTIRRGLPIR